MGYLKEIVDGGWSLIEGLRVTGNRLFRKIVTVQYPRKRLTMSPAYRGHIELIRIPERGMHNCIACGTCQRTCPSHVIKVQGVKKHSKGEKIATHYLIDFSKCSLCGLCVESCPTETIRFSFEYELEGQSRWSGVVNLMDRLKEAE